jgi:hypothetical protein
VIAFRRCTGGVIGRYRTGRKTGREVTNLVVSRTVLERRAKDGESPVGENDKTSWVTVLSTAGHEEPRGNSGGPPSKAKYSWRPIADKYREGKVKSTPGGE